MIPCRKREERGAWEERGKSHNSRAVVGKADVMGEGGDVREVVEKEGMCGSFSSFLLKPKVAPILVSLFLLSGSLMGYKGVTTIGKGITIADFLPKGSYVAEYHDKRDKWFGEVDRVEFITKVEVDVGLLEDRAIMENLAGSVEALSQTVGSPDCWYLAFKSHWNATQGGTSMDAAGADAVRQSFSDFMDTDAFVTRYSTSVYLSDDGMGGR